MANESGDAESEKEVLDGLVRSLEQEYGLTLTQAARNREREGFLHGIRAVFFILFKRANRSRFSPSKEVGPDPDLRLMGGWEPVSERTFESLGDDWKAATGLKPGDAHFTLAQELERKYHLSKFVERALMDEAARKMLAVAVIAAEAHFFEELGKARRVNQPGRVWVMEEKKGPTPPPAEEGATTPEEIQSMERRWGKWWG